MLYLVFFSQNELGDNIKIGEPLGTGYHNQIHFSIKIQTQISGKRRWKRNVNKCTYKQMRTYLASLNWTDLMKDKTTTECWIILKDEIEGIIENKIPITNQGNAVGRNTCQKKLYEKFPTSK